MTKTIVSDISIDELFNWLSEEGNKSLVERSSKVLSTFMHYSQVDDNGLPTQLAHESSRAISDLRSTLAVYQLVSERIELLEKL